MTINALQLTFNPFNWTPGEEILDRRVHLALRGALGATLSRVFEVNAAARISCSCSTLQCLNRFATEDCRSLRGYGRRTVAERWLKRYRISHPPAGSRNPQSFREGLRETFVRVDFTPIASSRGRCDARTVMVEAK